MTIGEEMEIGHFYYIDDQYFKDFPDSYLMQNKEKVNGQLFLLPCRGTTLERVTLTGH